MPITDLELLTPVARAKCRQFLAVANERLKPVGLKVRITETFRPQHVQDALYAKGRTKPGRKVTWTRRSKHTMGRAWDVCFASGVWWKRKVHPYDGHEQAWTVLGEIAADLRITWGGTWKTPDKPHFEV